MKVVKDKRNKRARCTPSDVAGGPDTIQRKTHIVTLKGSEVLVIRLKGNFSHELVVERNTVGDFCYLKQAYTGSVAEESSEEKVGTKKEKKKKTGKKFSTSRDKNVHYK